MSLIFGDNVREPTRNVVVRQCKDGTSNSLPPVEFVAVDDDFVPYHNVSVSRWSASACGATLPRAYSGFAERRSDVDVETLLQMAHGEDTEDALLAWQTTSRLQLSLIFDENFEIF